MLLELSPHHDPAAYAKVFKTYGRIHIPDLWTPESARFVHDTLSNKTEYNTVFNSIDKVFDLTDEAWSKMNPGELAQLTASIHAGAAERFQFLYQSHRMTEQGEPYSDEAHPLASVSTFLRGAPFLNFVRKVTGQGAIAFADAQATRYRAGHFLTTHTDDVGGKNRLAAYVINMTPRWRTDWGGLLLFSDGDGHVTEGYAPSFNAINMFRVPQSHLVSQVSQFTPADRLSITGWLRKRN